MTQLTQELGAYVAQLGFEQIPADAHAVIDTGFTDCVGVLLAGRNEPAPRMLQQMLEPHGGPATLLFGTAKASAAEAAWINGVAAHALDFDDVALRGHPSTVLVPAILAEGEAVGASGREMMVAYAAGYEVWAELARRDPDQHHNKGWHPTGIFGAIGAAAACASLHKLDAEKSAVAISLGASQSAGVMANFGTMAKPFHAGRSAHSGVVAARLARIGFTAALDALEHPQGFLAAVSPAGRVDLAGPAQVGKDWKLTSAKLSVKKYPLCFCTHRALDGMLDLLLEQSLEPDRIERITVSTSPRNAGMLRNHQPQTGLEAKFSMEFAVASAIIARRAGLGELTDGFVQRQDVQSLMKKVTVTPDPREVPTNPGYAPYDQVTVVLKDGSTIESRQVVAVRGGPDQPLSREDLWTKFEDCARIGRLEVPARALFDALMGLADITHVGRIPGLSPTR